MRFIGGHVYHCQLKRSGATVATGYVYLYPVTPIEKGGKPAGPQQVKFDESPAPPPSDDDAIQIMPKPGL